MDNSKLMAIIDGWREMCDPLIVDGWSGAIELCADEIEAAMVAEEGVSTSHEAKMIAYDIVKRADTISRAALVRLICAEGAVGLDAAKLAIAGLVDDGWIKGGYSYSAIDD